MDSYFASLLCLFLAVIKLSSVDSKPDLFLGKYPIPKKTPHPININTSEVHDAQLPPQILVKIVFALTKIVNTGELVKAILFQPATLGTATGGVLGNDLYEFNEFHFYWTDDLDGTAAGSIDGEGFPFQTIVYFRNRKYRTTSEALKHRDGYAILVEPFRICSTPNKLFDKFGEKIKQVQQPGSSTFAFLSTIVNAVDAIPLTGPYFAYPGSYIDDKGKQYYCGTVIFAVPNDKMCITEEQFKSTFGSLKNSQGGPLTDTLPQYPANMPIVKGELVIQPTLLFY